MEKTIKEIKENAKTLENAILKLISDFEVANPEVDILLLMRMIKLLIE